MSKPFTAAETGALERAREQFVYWNTDSIGERKPVDMKLLARVRKASRNLHRELTALIAPDKRATLSRLLVRMQEVEHLTQPQAAYYDELRHLVWWTIVLDLACGADVRPRRKSDQRVTEWIARAADEWASAGGTVSARHRFGRALLSYREPGIPEVANTSVIVHALAAWKAWRAQKGGDSRIA